MEANFIVKACQTLHRKGLVWGAALFCLVFFSLTARAPSGVIEPTPAEPVAREMAFEWALTAPGGDISPHEGARRGGFIDGAPVPVGRDVVTHYLQQMMLSGTEFSLRGPDGASPGLTLIAHSVAEGPAVQEDPAAVTEPCPDPRPRPQVAEARAAVEEKDPEPEPSEEDPHRKTDEVGVVPPVQLPEGVIALPVPGEVITGYGWVRCATLDEWIFHPGVDIRAEEGSPVRSVAAGQVLSVLDEIASGVTVTVAAKDLLFVYGAMASSEVDEGDPVSEGDVLGVIGAPPPREVGLPPHLHWEIRDGAGEPLELVVTAGGIKITR